MAKGEERLCTYWIKLEYTELSQIVVIGMAKRIGTRGLPG